MQTKNLTIMFTDLAGYTARTSRSSRSKFVELLDTYEEIVSPIFSKFKGHIVKEIGDAYMVIFESPTDAVLCGVNIQNTLFKHNRKVPEKEKLRVKIAINTGEVHIRKNDVYGEAVNIAARLEGVAQANEVFFTEAVYLAMNKAEIPSIFLGLKKFKGIPKKTRIYKVLGEYHKIILAKRRKIRKFRYFMHNTIWFIILLIILAGAFIALYFYLDKVGLI